MACAPGMFTIADLTDAPLAGAHVQGVLARYGELELSRFIGEMIRTLMSELMDDVLRRDRGAIWRGPSERRGGARRQAGRRPAFSPAHAGAAEGAQGLPVAQHVPPSPGDGLHDPRQGGGDRPVSRPLSPIPACCRPTGPRRRAARGAPATVVRDYIAGMTDSYALAEYARVFHTEIAALDIPGR